MSQLVEIYNRSKKLRPEQAKQIPQMTTDYFDRNGEFQNGWTNFQRKGDPTSWKSRALEYYGEELSTMVIPESFVRIEPEIPLNQWNPKNKYYVPGRTPGESNV